MLIVVVHVNRNIFLMHFLFNICIFQLFPLFDFVVKFMSGGDF